MMNLNREHSPVLKNEKQKSLSSHLWNIAWENHFPHYPNERTGFFSCSSEESISFLKKNLNEINRDDPGILPSLGLSESKLAYYKLSDHFIFQQDHENAGMFLGSVQDWSTYYLRYSIVLKQFRSQKIYSSFFTYLMKVLSSYSIEKVECDVAPSQTYNINFLNSQGFFVVGHSTHEYWGSLLKFRKYLSLESKEIFLSKFCVGLKPDLKTLRKGGSQ